MDDPDEFLVQGRCGNGNFSALAAGLEGSVRKATYLGSHMEYWVDCAIGELFVIDPTLDAPISSGSSVSIQLAGHGVTFVKD